MRPAVKDIAVVLGLSWLVRGLFVAAIGDARSLDVGYWEAVLQARDEGQNPYVTGVLNWPPLWLEVIVLLDAFADWLQVSFQSALRVYLVLVESAIVVTLYLTLVRVGATRAAVRRALLVGIALNPVMVILVCQHGNSDVNVGLLVTLACAALIAHEKSRDIVAWLAAGLFLGLGVLAKTTPLVLAPLLAPGARLASRGGRALGVTLFLLPAALGLAVLLALVPRAILDHVIGYRSTRGFWGFAGLLDEVTSISSRSALATALGLAIVAVAFWASPRLFPAAPRPARTYLLSATLIMLAIVVVVAALDRWTSIDARAGYGSAFTLGVLALVVWLATRLWREPPLTAAPLFLLVALIFMAVVAFGPGYGAHYAPWFVPALVATYVLLDDGWRKLLLIAYAIAALTYAVEYAFVPFLGSFATELLDRPDWVTDAEVLAASETWVLFRVPLFAVYLVVIAAGIERLALLTERSSAGSDERTSPPAGSRAATAPGRA